jgi:hypothetical protein
VTAADCPDPAACPVPDPLAAELRRLRTVPIPAETGFFTAFRRRYWPAIFNDSGNGDTRFAPLRDGDGAVVPTLYAARTATVALLETAFHEVNPDGARLISESVDLAPRGLARLTIPTRLAFIDLRDEALAQLGLTRGQLVATLPTHYCCTRKWAEVLHQRASIGRARPVGLLWNSRQAELAQADSLFLDDLLEGRASETLVLFGDRVSAAPAQYRPSEVYDDLSGPRARIMIEEVARQLSATVVAN